METYYDKDSSESDLFDELIDNISEFTNSENENNSNLRRFPINIKAFMRSILTCFIKNPLE